MRRHASLTRLGAQAQDPLPRWRTLSRRYITEGLPSGAVGRGQGGADVVAGSVRGDAGRAGNSGARRESWSCDMRLTIRGAAADDRGRQRRDWIRRCAPLVEAAQDLAAAVEPHRSPGAASPAVCPVSPVLSRSIPGDGMELAAMRLRTIGGSPSRPGRRGSGERDPVSGEVCR